MTAAEGKAKTTHKENQVKSDLAAKANRSGFLIQWLADRNLAMPCRRRRPHSNAIHMLNGPYGLPCGLCVHNAPHIHDIHCPPACLPAAARHLIVKYISIIFRQTNFVRGSCCCHCRCLSCQTLYLIKKFKSHREKRDRKTENGYILWLECWLKSSAQIWWCSPQQEAHPRTHPPSSRVQQFENKWVNPDSNWLDICLLVMHKNQNFLLLIKFRWTAKWCAHVQTICCFEQAI